MYVGSGELGKENKSGRRTSGIRLGSHADRPPPPHPNLPLSAWCKYERDETDKNKRGQLYQRARVRRRQRPMTQAGRFTLVYRPGEGWDAAGHGQIENSCLAELKGMRQILSKDRLRVLQLRQIEN
ncbi:hypothetical protein RRG08_016475 [Elysia crispata]|uniref:Uncharacterized protein n=1 Tax=Elysia crispata TaxID=231223 RepID=A0AAE0Y943_9GAST|nr:hypothetical protein RRG08_016475 [Elysia crispata]